MTKENKTDIKKIKELIHIMKDNDLVEVEIVDGENKILLKRPHPNQPVITQVPAAPVAIPAEQKFETQTSREAEELVEIPSPIVGTFYSAPAPDAKPYVKVGSRVDADTVICVIEAMKVMNEIKAETTGTIAEILCKAGQAVEYGHALFKVRPD